MIVTGCICIYSLLLGIEVVSAPELQPLYFYIVSHFTLKGKKQICSNYDISRILNTCLSFTMKEFLNILSL